MKSTIKKQTKNISEKLDNIYIIKLIESSKSDKDLGKDIKDYYNYIKNNLHNDK
tara:strand:- start:174 stop:335 length:162 start_codon:yes stop_codon:yes gene_type:complete